VIQFVSDLREVGGFLRVIWFPTQMKTDRHDIVETLLKVAVNTITITLVRDSSAVRRLFVTALAKIKAVGRQRNLGLQ
jgi:hypothetical protein